MSHPLDQLAPFVDGMLGPSERAVVEDHLRACARCRREVDAAAAARAAVRAMPVLDGPDLESRFAPDRLAELAASRSASRAPWSRLAPILAAAAAVALIAIVIPRVGDVGGGGAETAADGLTEAGAGDAPSADLRLEIVTTDYDVDSLEASAASFLGSGGGGQPPEADQAGGGTEGAAPDASDEARFAGPGRTARAVACLRRAFPGFPGEIVQVMRASFEGEPAYLGYVLEGPGAGRPPEALSIWVAAIDDCSILTIASARP